ncbi:MAG TPA: hypothetical protein VJX29_03780 [Candidatus Acidoferrales bacterium]|nr:hypothetical protein [Candidatus Acidoferrales bacterium]
MNKAYRFVFVCPKGGHDISLERKCSRASLSELEAMELFGGEKISCANPQCGWRGKASKATLRRILPFNWIYSPAD